MKSSEAKKNPKLLEQINMATFCLLCKDDIEKHRSSETEPNRERAGSNDSTDLNESEDSSKSNN